MFELLNLKKKNTEKLLNWDVHYVGIKAKRVHQQNCITLDEVALEASRLLSLYVPIITEDKVAFTAWVERALKEPINYQKKNCLKWSWEK